MMAHTSWGSKGDPASQKDQKKKEFGLESGQLMRSILFHLKFINAVIWERVDQKYFPYYFHKAWSSTVLPFH